VGVTGIERFRQLYEWAPRILCAGQFVPALGDAFGISHRAPLCTYDNYRFAYDTFREPLYAQILRGLEADSRSNLFARAVPPEELRSAPEEPIGYTSQHLAEYRQAILQNGRVERPVAVSMHYGQNHTHDHRDKMQLDIYARGVSLIPDFGYPETANATDPRRGGFFHHTISHNTVMIDEGRQQASHDGYCIAFDPGPVCGYMEAEGNGAYPQAGMYRRAVALVDGGGDRDYIIDVFRVRGGDQHDWLVHGTKASFDTSLPLSEPQREGTLAGSDVPYGYFYDDAEIRDLPEGSTSYFRYRGSGFHYLYNSQQADLTPGSWVRWRVEPHENPTERVHVTADDGAFLKAHLVGHDERILVADGKPQQHYDTAPESVKFVLRRRTGTNLSSQFATVFEPGAHSGFIERVEGLDVGQEEVVALRLTLESGEVHYYLHAAEPVAELDVEESIRFAGRVGFLGLDADGRITQAYTHQGRLRRHDWSLEAPGALQRTVIACDYERNRITLDGDVPAEVVGSTLNLTSGPYRTTFVAAAIDASDTIQLDGGFPAAGRLTVRGIDAASRQVDTPTEMTRATAGMHLVSEGLVPIAQAAEGTGKTALILDRPVALSDLAPAGSDTVRAWLMPYGPGTVVEVPGSARSIDSGS
jgi:hypothetical protein